MEDLEYKISQYLDGILPPEEKAQLEQLLEQDKNARALLEEYRNLDRVILTAAGPLPEINWNALASQISSAIDNGGKSTLGSANRSFWNIRRASIALAACLAIAISVAFHLIHAPSPALPQAPLAKAEIHGPQIESATGPSVAEITLLPPPSLADAARVYPYAEGVVVQPSRVSIASAMKIPQ